MTETDLLKQLKSLKNINPEAAWLKRNREILLSQISNSGAKELSPWCHFSIDLRSLLQTVSQPAMAFASLFILLVGASAFGHLAFKQAKPNDSLYIARIISEKAKLSTVFNSAEREKLEVKFAASHAETITEMLAGTEIDAANQDQVAKLNDSFNKEIETVRTKMAAIKKNNPVSEDVAIKPLVSEEELLITAGNTKDDAGTQLLINNDNIPVDKATETEMIKIDAPAPIVNKAPEQVLAEVQTLFDNKEYNEALDKLKEVKELIK